MSENSSVSFIKCYNNVESRKYVKNDFLIIVILIVVVVIFGGYRMINHSIVDTPINTNVGEV